MTDILLKYPLDTKGTNPANKVTGETHAINGREVRFVIPDYGLYFTKSMVPVDTSTGAVLQAHQWRPGEVDVGMTAKYGKEIAAGILITEPTMDGPISLTYQALGGEQSISKRALIDMLATINLNGDPIDFKDIVGFPAEVTPLPHKQHVSTVFAASSLTEALARLKAAVQTGNRAAMAELYDFVEAAMAAGRGLAGNGATSVMAEHKAAPNPHPELALVDSINEALAQVRQPINIVPTDAASSVGLETPLTGYKYQSLYGVAQKSAQFQLSKFADMRSPIYDRTIANAVVSFQPEELLAPGTVYYWRCRYTDMDGTLSKWSPITSFNTADISVVKPLLTSPAPDVETKSETPTLTTNAFAMVGATDTHVATDWEVWTGPNGTGTRVWSSVNDLANKLTINVGPNVLVQEGKYYARARHRATKYGYSAWTDNVMFIAKWDPRPSVVGQNFGGGYYVGDIVIGVGTYAVILAPKANEMTGKLTSNTSFTNNTSTIDSVLNTAALVEPIAGDNVISKVKALNIGGFNDWQIPALAVQQLIWANLRGTLASAPAAFKTGGSEFIPPSYYWTSTAYNWTDSYQDPSTPIYGQIDNRQSKSATVVYFPSSNGSTPPATCPSGQNVQNVTHGYYYMSQAYNPASGKFEQASQNSTYWQCQFYTTGVVGYKPGATHTTPYYDVKVMDMGNAGGNTNVSKTSNYVCRPVRIVRVA